MNIANRITIIRIVLVPFFILSIISYAPDKEYLRFLALGLFVICSLTDFLDGYFARRLKQETEIGRILDVLADKIFLISSYLVLAIFSKMPIKLPLEIAFVIIIRDLVVIAGIIFLYILFKRLYILPSILGKISITVEMLMVISILLLFKYSYIVWYLALILAILSGLGYLLHFKRIIKGKGVIA